MTYIYTRPKRERGQQSIHYEILNRKSWVNDALSAEKEKQIPPKDVQSLARRLPRNCSALRSRWALLPSHMAGVFQENHRSDRVKQCFSSKRSSTETSIAWSLPLLHRPGLILIATARFHGYRIQGRRKLNWIMKLELYNSWGRCHPFFRETREMVAPDLPHACTYEVCSPTNMTWEVIDN